ncbi:ABC transporter ATP-binding protein [Immundisolibacter cernigliae]|uniref:ABC transporter ATP-binding protein n=1 Tax=Immundisolibacter cernigliae TaxID=1810504 RepID=UPI00096ACE81|nr:ABC transporter ATP-binding protein [Immundisolibacter cernigliae]
MVSSEPVISVENVSISYPIRSGFIKWKKYFPLKNVSFDVYKGETVGLIGRNGAGKSSLLRMIAGIVDPDAGKIANYEVSVSLLALGVGFVPHLTGRENVILSGMLMGMHKRDIEARMDSIIEFAGIGDFIDQPLRVYSSGMRSRISFATAIQTDPDVLLVDEVLGVGDEEFRVKSLGEMKKLIRSEKTVVLVSHQTNVIKELCDRVVWIDDGEVRFVGNTAEGLVQYGSAMVKS